MKDNQDLRELIKDIIGQIENKGNVKAVFGDPVEKGDVVVIPVAKSHFAGGGGAGEGNEDEEDDDKKEGKGGGVGYYSKSKPVGFIELQDDYVEFHQIHDREKMFSLMLVAIGLVGIVLRVLGGMAKK